MATYSAEQRGLALGQGASSLLRRLIFSAITMLAVFPVEAAPTFTLTVLPYFNPEMLRVAEDGTPYLAPLPLLSIQGFQGWAVNSAGVYAGACGSGPTAACIYSDLLGIEVVGFDRPPNTTQQIYSTYAYDVNERGDVLGGATDWNNGNTNIALQIRIASGDLLDLPGITSYRRPSFNLAYEVVGSGISGDAFYYAGGTRTPLSSLVTNLGGFTIIQPTDISDTGYIVGMGVAGYDDNSRPVIRGFLLTPPAPPEPEVTVPEPTSLALGLLGLAAAAAVRIRTRRHGSPPGS